MNGFCLTFLSTLGVLALTGQAAEGIGRGGPIAKVFTDWSQDFYGERNSRVEITRAYLGYHYEFNPSYSSKFILDVGRLNELTAATLDTSGSIVTSKKESRYESFLKNASLEIRGTALATTAEMGLVGTRLFSIQEKAWGHRYIAKSLMDEKKFSPSADLGVNILIQPHRAVKIHASILQGEGFTAPQDTRAYYKTGAGVEAALPLGLTLFAFADRMPVNTDVTQITLAGFLGIALGKRFSMGAELDMQWNNFGIEKHDLTGVSGYASASLFRGLSILGRVDYLTSEGHWLGSGDGRAYITGLQYAAVQGVKLAAAYHALDSHGVNALQDKVSFNVEFTY